MRFMPPNCKRLQGAADARRRARRRTFVLQVPDNEADAVPCERLRKIIPYPLHGVLNLTFSLLSGKITLNDKKLHRSMIMPNSE